MKGVIYFPDFLVAVRAVPRSLNASLLLSSSPPCLSVSRRGLDRGGEVDEGKLDSIGGPVATQTEEDDVLEERGLVRRRVEGGVPDVVAADEAEPVVEAVADLDSARVEAQLRRLA